MLQTTPPAESRSDLSHLHFFPFPECFLGLDILTLSLQEIHKMRAQGGGSVHPFVYSYPKLTGLISDVFGIGRCTDKFCFSLSVHYNLWPTASRGRAFVFSSKTTDFVNNWLTWSLNRFRMFSHSVKRFAVWPVFGERDWKVFCTSMGLGAGGVVCCGVLWCGVLWCGVLWCGVEWCVVVWSGVEWSGVLWCEVVCCGVEWSGVVWCGVEWCVVVWSGVLWCGVEWCVVVCELRQICLQ
jgi:hypothetical protein